MKRVWVLLIYTLLIIQAGNVSGREGVSRIDIDSASGTDLKEGRSVAGGIGVVAGNIVDNGNTVNGSVVTTINCQGKKDCGNNSQVNVNVKGTTIVFGKGNIVNSVTLGNISVMGKITVICNSNEVLLKTKTAEIYQQRGLDTSKLLKHEPECSDEQAAYYKEILSQFALAHPNTSLSSTVTLEKKE